MRLAWVAFRRARPFSCGAAFVRAGRERWVRGAGRTRDPGSQGGAAAEGHPAEPRRSPRRVQCLPPPTPAPAASVSGPTRKMPPGASAMDFFQLFVPDNVLKNMVVQTNMYAKKFQERFGSDGAWAEVTLTEMKAFLGYMISTSISHCESVLSIWSGGFYSNRSLALVMSQARFEKILKYFHVVAFRSSQTTHGLYKVQPFLDSLQNGFDSAFRPSQTQVRPAGGWPGPHCPWASWRVAPQPAFSRRAPLLSPQTPDSQLRGAERSESRDLL